MFLGDYLTSEGQPGAADLQMIRDAGFTVEGIDEQTLPPAPVITGEPVTLRRRGAGTNIPSNI
jgi:biotin synthase